MSVSIAAFHQSEDISRRVIGKTIVHISVFVDAWHITFSDGTIVKINAANFDDLPALNVR